MEQSDTFLLRLGQKVRHQRELRKLTRKELARRAGLSDRFLADVERGRANPSVLRLAKLASELGMSLEELFREIPETSARRVIALLGLRGAGKSSVGQSLAKELGCQLIELDSQVEQVVGLRIGEIFEIHGEQYYRSAEFEVLQEVLADPEPKVLATGGGLVTESQTFTLLRKAAHTVWLKARAEDHWARVTAQGDTRPMAGIERAFSNLCTLLDERQKLYQQADLTLDTSDRSVSSISHELAQRYLPLLGIKT